MKVTHKLVEGRHGHFYVVSGNPEIGYTLHACETETVGHYKRSWQAVARAKDGIDPQDGAA